MAKKPLDYWLLSALFLCPYLLLLLNIQRISFPPSDELIWALKNSLVQSLGSALLALLLGGFLAAGVYEISHRSKHLEKWMQALLVTPIWLPSFFILLTVTHIMPVVPMGLPAVIFVHGVLYAGLVSQVLIQSVVPRLAGLSDVASVLSVQAFQFWGLAFRSLRTELWRIFLIIFTFSFCSFSIPLALGGGTGTTLEVLIYEKIRISQDVSQALGLSVLQLGLFFLLSLTLKKDLQWAKNNGVVRYARHWSWALMPICYVLVLMASLFFGVANGFLRLMNEFSVWTSFAETLPLTLMTGFVAGLLFLLLTLLIFSAIRFSSVQDFFSSYLSPGVAIMALSFIIYIPFGAVTWGLVGLVAGLLLVSGPFLWRWLSASDQGVFRQQLAVAETIGASNWQFFKWILFPQLKSSLTLVSFVFSVWVIGDFALARMLLPGDQLSALVIQNHMNRYRLDLALFLFFVLMIFSSMLYFFYKGINSELHRWFKKDLSK